MSEGRGRVRRFTSYNFETVLSKKSAYNGP